MTPIVILGSTGSIGRQTLDVVRQHRDRLRVIGIAGRNEEQLARQAAELEVPNVAIGGDTPRQPSAFPAGTRVRHGAGSLVELAALPEAAIVVVATVGSAGLGATLAAIAAGKRVAIANKEVLVMAGAIITAAARRHGATLLPIDSEHSALWQCLLGEQEKSVAALLLTASGGALRDRNPAELGAVTPEEALRHPTWVMGPKITVDCATLMNKGLEVIEAHWLFGVPYERIKIVMHPSSIVHSLVQFTDGTIKAQLGAPNMTVPIQYALSHPERWPSPAEKLDIINAGSLQFAEPPAGRYPCLDLALQAARAGGTYPSALCGADEVAVELFLDGRIRFTEIPVLVEAVLGAHTPGDDNDLEAVVAADDWARRECRRLAEQ